MVATVVVTPPPPPSTTVRDHRGQSPTGWSWADDAVGAEAIGEDETPPRHRCEHVGRRTGERECSFSAADLILRLQVQVQLLEQQGPQQCEQRLQGGRVGAVEGCPAKLACVRGLAHSARFLLSSLALLLAFALCGSETMQPSAGEDVGCMGGLEPGLVQPRPLLVTMRRQESATDALPVPSPPIATRAASTGLEAPLAKEEEEDEEEEKEVQEVEEVREDEEKESAAAMESSWQVNTSGLDGAGRASATTADAGACSKARTEFVARSASAAETWPLSAAAVGGKGNVSVGGEVGFQVPGLLFSSPTRVVVRDPQGLMRKAKDMRRAGPAKIQVIADFDRTLTRYRVNGQRGISSHGLVKLDDPTCHARVAALFDKYHPKEVDPTIPLHEKTRLMEQWWHESHSAMLQGGYSLDAIRHAVANAQNLQLRDGTAELFAFLEELDIPVLIFSAGLADMIEEVLRQRLPRLFRDVRVVSNRMKFDSSGRLIGFEGRTIHVLNKNEHALEMAAPLHTRAGGEAVVAEGVGECSGEVRRHTHVVLLGDHLGDLGMSQGVHVDNQISIGFLNDDVKRQLDTYSKEFDVVILDDGPISVVTELLQGVLTGDRIKRGTGNR